MWASQDAPSLGPVWHGLGNLGVRIFFTLSGFLITWLLLDEHKRNAHISLRAFYVRRFFRIFPVYYIYIGVLAVFQLAGLYADAGTTWFGSLTFTRNIIGQGDSATGHLWSLAVEEQFYLVWPTLLVMLSLPERQRMACMVLGIVIVSAIITRPITCHDAGLTCRILLHPNSALRYADCLAIGSLGAFLRSNWRPPSARIAQMIAPGAALALAVSSLFGPALDPWKETILIDAQAWLTIVAMISSAELERGLWFALLNSRPVVFIGVLSYSLYIWHLIFLRNYVGPEFPLGVFGDWKIWWLAAIIIATLSYYALERPILNLAKHWKR